jgi:DNA polymerase III alpha subunit (gram-positive type)
MMEDGCSAEDRVFCAQNADFDVRMCVQLWKKCKSLDTFPFGKRPLKLDTMQIELFLSLCREQRNKYYNLSSLVEKYGVKKEKAHRADGDVKMTKDVLFKQIDFVKSFIKK